MSTPTHAGPSPLWPMVLATSLCATPAQAETYDVGDAMAYSAIGDVPWESLMPGDVVRIHHRAMPYKEKWVIGRRGTEQSPIVVQGVLGPNGERPIIDGRDATTRSALNYTNGARGVIKIGSSNTPQDTLPAWIVIENLDVRSGRPPYTFTDEDGVEGSYSNNAAAIYVEKAENLVLRNNVLRDSGNGLFIGAYDGMTQHILIEGNHIHDNGMEGRIYEHNSYTAAIDITFQHNHYGPLRAGCDGNNLKDRSAGLVVRYNWIESGNRQLDLVDAEDSQVLVDHPSYSETFVYGNLLIEHEGDGNSQIIHYGGDSGTEADYRKGTLHLFHNTIVSTRDGNTTLLSLSTDAETADVRNNIVMVTAGGSRLALLSDNGTLSLASNWLPDGFRTSHGNFVGTIEDDQTGLVGATPGFVDIDQNDFQLVDGSPCLGAAGPLSPSVVPDHALRLQYVMHQATEGRPQDDLPDLGAYERCADGACPVVTPDNAGDGDGDGDRDTGGDGDAGGSGGSASGTGGGGGASSGNGADAGVPSPGSSSSDDGCGCSTPGHARDGGGAGGIGARAVGSLLVLMMLWRTAGRKRRR